MFTARWLCWVAIIAGRVGRSKPFRLYINKNAIVHVTNLRIHQFYFWLALCTVCIHSFAHTLPSITVDIASWAIAYIQISFGSIICLMQTRRACTRFEHNNTAIHLSIRMRAQRWAFIIMSQWHGALTSLRGDRRASRAARVVSGRTNFITRMYRRGNACVTRGKIP